MTSRTLPMLVILLLLAIVGLGCANNEVQRRAVTTRAANEHDCHRLAVTVVAVEDARKVWRANGCGHETFWECRSYEEGPDICDRVGFPEGSRFLRF
ncbi:MAG: hypothetical protein AAFX99_31760 [Myxococcota bacterium]